MIEWIRDKAARPFLAVAATVLVCGALTGCATTGVAVGDDSDRSEISDPFEGFNRGMFAVNEGIDKALLEPVAKGYRAVTPKGIRLGMRNFLRNLKSPIVIGNEILQGDMDGTGNAVARMFINTLAGFGGILDLAAEGGIDYEQEDFGQTLAVWGVDHGPYIVLPVLGPSSARDGTGMLADAFADPLRLYLFNTNQEEWHYVRLAAGAVDQREELIDVIKDLRRNSIDYYATVRSTYAQRREALVRDEESDASAAPAIPNYDE